MTTLDFSFDGGTRVETAYQDLGVTISVDAVKDRGNNGGAMVFDTGRPTGGDDDLAFEGRGGALIISEDNDSDDPDDDRDGGVITFDFDDPQDVTSLTMLDGEEGGEIRAYDADGALIGTFEIPKGADNDARTLDLPFKGVSSLEVELRGSGAIDDLVIEPSETAPTIVNPTVTEETAGGNPVTFELETPATVTEETSTLTASLTLGVGGDVNVAFVIDDSGSTTNNVFGGSSVGDLNGDGLFDTVLDAEIASLLNLSDAIADLGLADDQIQIGLVSFEEDAALLGSFEPGSEGLEGQLTALDGVSFTQFATNFEAALRETINFFEAENAEGDTNIVYFLSDGFPNTPDFGDPSAFLDEAATLFSEFDAQIIAVGVGASSSLDDLDLIDNTGGAEIVTTTDALTTELLEPAVPVAVEDFVVTVNGVEQTDITEDDLLETPFGFVLPSSEIGNLDPDLGFENEVEAEVTFDDGTNLELEASIFGAGFVIETEAFI